MIIKPPPLNPGDIIGVIAPAGPLTRSELQPAIDVIITKGYRVIQAPHLYNKRDYLAGYDDVRLEDLHSMFQDKDIKGVLCARGGYGTLRLLDKIDYDLIRRNPKIILGYSDISALLLALFRKTGLVTFHGPMVRELSGNYQKMDDFFNLVTSDGTFEMDLSGGAMLVHGKARGILLGGNLSLISSMVGTPFMPSMKDVVLFIEDKGEPLYRIDRMLTHLRLNGILKDLAGLIAGGFVDCGDITDINRLLTDIVSGCNFPVFSGLPVGHGTRNITIPLGLHVNLDTMKKSLSIEEGCVST